MSRLDGTSETDVLSWWNAGVKTVDDLRNIGNQGIAWHQAKLAEAKRNPEAERRRREAEAARLRTMTERLRKLADEPWTAQVWWRDPRFRNLLPRRDVTVQEICSDGSLKEHQQLWTNTDELTARIQHLDEFALAEAISGYVEAISGQRGIRLEALLARTGLGGQDPITRRETAERLGVSNQRIYQIVAQLHRHRDRAIHPTASTSHNSTPQSDTVSRHPHPSRRPGHPTVLRQVTHRTIAPPPLA